MSNARLPNSPNIYISANRGARILTRGCHSLRSAVGQCTIVVIIDLVARRYAILAPNPNASQVPARARNRRLVCHGRPKSRGRQTAALCRSNRKPTDRPTTAYGAVQPVTVDVAYGRRCPTSAVRNTRRDRLNRGVTCRSEFTRPARRSSSEQTFAHWRRGMGVAVILPATRPCAQRPPEALPPRGRKIRGKRAAKLSFHAATRA